MLGRDNSSSAQEKINQQGQIRIRLRILLLCLTAVASILLIIRLWPVVMPFFLALMFTYLLRPLYNRMLGLGIPSALAVLLLYGYVGIGIYLLLFICLPIVSEQFSRLLAYLPQLFSMLQQAWQQITATMRHIELPAGLQAALTEAGSHLREQFAERMEGTATHLSSLLRLLAYLVLMPVLSFYMLRNKQAGAQKLLALVSPQHMPETLRLLQDLDHLLRSFIGGYLLVSLVVAVMSAIFYQLIGLEYALALGLLMGVADLIPYFGPFLGAIPAIIVALGDGVPRALICTAGLLFLQQLGSAVITPKIMGDKIGLNPLLTIFAVMAGGYLFGIFGTILALPVAAALLLLGKYFYGRLVGVNTDG